MGREPPAVLARMVSPWRIELFGGLRAVRAAADSAQIVARFRTQKTGALLAYLAFHLGKPQPREPLIELLWPEDDLDAGRHKLSVALSSLRAQLEPAGMAAGSVLEADRVTVALNPAAIVTDVAEFDAALSHAGQAETDGERTRRLEEAVRLYRGEFLAGYYEEWVQQEQRRLADRYLQATHQLIGLAEAAGDLERARGYARRALEADACCEAAHQDLIRLYAAAGDRPAALRQYQELARLLKEELGIPPSAATRSLVEGIANGDSRGPIARSAAGGEPPGESATATTVPTNLEPVGGAVPLDSPFYVVRSTDEAFCAAIARRDSLVLVKGAREVGKSSLLARGLQHARQGGARVVLTSLERLNAAQMGSADRFLLAMAALIAEQLELDAPPEAHWNEQRGPNLNFSRYLHRVALAEVSEPVVWGLDEVDRLIPCDFGAEVLAMFRSWHNERALDPSGPWHRLTLAIAYASEAHLFITDANQSPFNVGTRLTLEDFTLEQVADLNARYGRPLRSGEEALRFHGMVGGHPYLVRCGLHELAASGAAFSDFEARAGSADRILGGHLRRVLSLLAEDAPLREAMRAVLRGLPCPDESSFYRLRTAGLILGDSEENVRPRCGLYARYLSRQLL